MRRTVLVVLAVVIGWTWLHRGPDRRVPGPSTAWTVWYRDTFEGEDTEPSPEARGTGILGGLEAVWRATAFEGIEDEDGDATFSAFTLTWGTTAAESAWVEVKSFDNTALLAIRRWWDPGVAAAIAKAHLHLLEHSDRWSRDQLSPSRESLPILEAAAAATDRADFVRRLAAL